MTFPTPDALAVLGKLSNPRRQCRRFAVPPNKGSTRCCCTVSCLEYAWGLGLPTQTEGVGRGANYSVFDERS
eukprot:gene12617-biopygen12491